MKSQKSICEGGYNNTFGLKMHIGPLHTQPFNKFTVLKYCQWTENSDIQTINILFPE